jgi:hypothetical protein
VLCFAARLAGLPATVETGAVVRIATAGGTLIANLGGAAVVLPAGARGRVICAATEDAAARDANWAFGPAADLGGALLAPMDVALLDGEVLKGAA